MRQASASVMPMFGVSKLIDGKFCLKALERGYDDDRIIKAKKAFECVSVGRKVLVWWENSMKKGEAEPSEAQENKQPNKRTTGITYLNGMSLRIWDLLQKQQQQHQHPLNPQ